MAQCMVVQLGKGSPDSYHNFVHHLLKVTAPLARWVRIRYTPGEDGEQTSWAYINTATALPPHNGLIGDEQVAAGLLSAEDYLWVDGYKWGSVSLMPLFQVWEDLWKFKVEAFQDLSTLHRMLTTPDRRVRPQEGADEMFPMLVEMCEDEPARQTLEALLTEACGKQVQSLPVGKYEGKPRQIRVALPPFDEVQALEAARGYASDLGVRETVTGLTRILLRVQQARDARALACIDRCLALLKGHK